METKTRAKQQPSLYFSVKQKHKIISAYLNGGQSKQQIWKAYTGETKEKGKLLKWMRQLGYIEGNIVKKSPSFYMKNRPITSKSVELLQRDKEDTKCQELEQKLADSHLREQSYLLMIELAEKELKINIRKKSSTR